jgi:hypothetical protein
MRVTTLEGIIENGQIRVSANIRLPEGARVYIVIPDVEMQQIVYIGSPRLVHPEQVEDFKKEVIIEGSHLREREV